MDLLQGYASDEDGDLVQAAAAEPRGVATAAAAPPRIALPNAADLFSGAAAQHRGADHFSSMPAPQTGSAAGGLKRPAAGATTLQPAPHKSASRSVAESCVVCL